MLPRDMFVRVSYYLFQLVFVSSGCGPGIETVENRVANHAEVRRISRLELGNDSERWFIMTEWSVPAVNQLVMLTFDFYKSNPAAGSIVRISISMPISAK